MLLRTTTSCLLVAVLLVTRTWQQSIPGFSNVRFTVQPHDRYLLPTGSSSTFRCEAEGISNTTNTSSPISIVIYVNDLALNRFDIQDPDKFFLYTKGGSLNIPTAVEVSNIALADNGMRVHCEVADCPLDGSACTGLGINSTIATLVVADGRPPAVPLTQSNSTIHSVTVKWSDVLVPQNAPLVGYNVTLLHPQSNQLLFHEHVTNPVNVSQYAFVDLDPETSYHVNVVGINHYGVGNNTMEPFTITTATPIVPGSPMNVKTKRFPITRILVTWMAPTIDPLRQTPVTRYVLSYHPVGLPQNRTSLNISVDGSLLQYIIPAAATGTNYSISIAAVNTAGLGLPALANIETAPTNVTPSIPEPMPQTSSAYLQTTPSIMPTPLFTPAISSSSSSKSSSLSSTISSAAAISSSSSITVMSTTSHAMSTSISEQSSHTSINNIVHSVVMETPTRPPTDNAMPNQISASVIIIASAAVAFTLIVVILIIAIALIVVCVKNLRHDSADHDFTDLPKDSPWIGRQAEKRSSVLKDVSSVSSDSNEMSNRSSSSQDSPTGATRPNFYQEIGSTV